MTTQDKAMSAIELLDQVESGLRVAMVASCDCNHPANISPEPDAHEPSCRYRVLWVAADKAADLRAALRARSRSDAPR